MKKIVPVIVSLALVFGMAGCTAKKDEQAKGTEEVTTVAVEDTEETTESENADADKITDAQALSGVKNYCYEQDSTLKGIEDSGEHELYWELESSSDDEIVVLYRSYTSAQVRYYIDRNSGETYITEFMPNTSTEEEKTGETFNIRDYIGEETEGPEEVNVPEDVAAAEEEALANLTKGMWQTASVGYTDGDEMQPDYYVQITDKEVKYGHMKDGQFVLDHSDTVEEIIAQGNGRYRIKVSSAEGIKYTYQTSLESKDVLEYYDTWDEDQFPEMYKGGASLSRVD